MAPSDSNIKVFIYETRENALQGAFELLRDAITKKHDIVLGGATGRSPEGLYKKLLESAIDISQTKMIFLDEYVGRMNYYLYTYGKLCPKFQEENLTVPLGIFSDTDHRILSSGRLDGILEKHPTHWKAFGPEIRIKDDSEAEQEGVQVHPCLKAIRNFCTTYEEKIDRMKIEYQILGIGVDGHIGFNECGTHPESLTHLTRLADSTLEINHEDFPDGVLTHYAVTQGIQTIAKAKQRILLAFSETKQKAVKSMLRGEISPNNPAAYLRTMPGTTTIFLDESAASMLERPFKLP